MNPFFIPIASENIAAFFEEYQIHELDQADHVIKILSAIERELMNELQAGDFVHAICIGDYAQAIDRADPINAKNIKLYRQFELFLKSK